MHHQLRCAWRCAWQQALAQATGLPAGVALAAAAELLVGMGWPEVALLVKLAWHEVEMGGGSALSGPPSAFEPSLPPALPPTLPPPLPPALQVPGIPERIDTLNW